MTYNETTNYRELIYIDTIWYILLMLLINSSFGFEFKIKKGCILNINLDIKINN